MNEHLIVLTLDSDSFRLHAQEQGGTVADVAETIEQMAMYQIAKFNFRPMAAALLQGRAFTLRATLHDEYADHVAPGEDDDDALLEQAAWGDDDGNVSHYYQRGRRFLPRIVREYGHQHGDAGRLPEERRRIWD